MFPLIRFIFYWTVFEELYTTLGVIHKFILFFMILPKVSKCVILTGLLYCLSTTLASHTVGFKILAFIFAALVTLFHR
jgi:hypothetical protein